MNTGDMVSLNIVFSLYVGWMCHLGEQVSMGVENYSFSLHYKSHREMEGVGGLPGSLCLSLCCQCVNSSKVIPYAHKKEPLKKYCK